MKKLFYETDSNITISPKDLSSQIDKLLVIEHIKSNQHSMTDTFYYHLANNKTLDTLWFNSNKDYQ